MKKVLLALMFILFSEAVALMGQEQDALTAARKIWSTSAFVRKAGNNYQVGCVVNGNQIVVGKSKQSYSDALSKVNLKTNGLHMLSATVFSASGETAESAPVPLILCNP